jgi:hypothetical protein
LIEDNWRGGFYELAILLGPRDDACLESALRACWGFKGVAGCFGSRSMEPASQERVEPTLSNAERFGHLRGVASVPGVSDVVCGTVIIREEDSGEDWLDFYLPVGALSNADRRVGAYPFGDNESSLVWRRPIDEWFALVGRQIFDRVSFRLALIGFEVSGLEDLIDSDTKQRGMAVLRPTSSGLVVEPASV